MKGLKEKRLEKGLTQQALGEKVGVDRNIISSYERGEHFPRKAMLDKLAFALECEIKDIV